MAVINNFIGWETGGPEQASATVGAGSFVQTSFPDPPTPGTYFMLVDDGGNQEFEWEPFTAGVANAGNDHIIAGYFAPDWATDTDPLFSVDDSAGVQIIKVLFDHSPTPEIQIENSVGTDVGSVLQSFGDDTWQFIELVWQNSATGSATLFVNGVESINVSSSDFSGTIDHIIWQNEGGSGRIHADDVYWLSGCAGAQDRLGPCYVLKYQSSKASATPDDGGTVLPSGTWASLGETPAVDTPIVGYTSAGAGAVDADATNGDPEGPLNDPRVTGDILAMMGIFRLSRGTGGGTAHFGLIGNDVGGTEQTRDFSPPNSPLTNFMHVSTSALVPTKNEHFRIGIETTGAQDWEGSEMWGMILARVPAGELNNPIFRPNLRGWGW